MIRKHALIVSLILGLAAAAGAVAAVRTAHLGQSSAKATTSTAQTGALLKRQRLLNREEAALKRAPSKRPPKLPQVPKFPAAAPQAQLASGSAPAAPSVRYVRPAPIVVVTHRSHNGEGESHDDGGEGGGDD